MINPWLAFVAITLGLLQGGGVAVLQAPTRWLLTGLDAGDRVMPALACAVAALP